MDTTRTAQAEQRRTRRSWAFVTIPLGLAAASLVIWQASYAAFTGSTTVSANSLAAGTVTLTQNSSGALFASIANLKPGDTGHACVEVDYTGSVTPSVPVSLYAANVTGSGTADVATSLARNVVFTSEITTADSTGTFTAPFTPGDACEVLTGTTVLMNGAGKLYDLTSRTSTTGLSTGWTPAQGSKRVFRFTWTLPSGVVDDSGSGTTMQGTNVNFDITWGATS